MNDPPLADEVRARMRRIRREIDQGMEDIDQDMKDMVDWKYYVKTYPWVCLGTAALLGFLVFPRPSTAKRVLGTLSEMAEASHLVVKPAPAPTRGWVGGLLATVANIAIREAVTYLGRSAGMLLGSGTDTTATPAARSTQQRL